MGGIFCVESIPLLQFRSLHPFLPAFSNEPLALRHHVSQEGLGDGLGNEG
jgi:hypothetical protein